MRMRVWVRACVRACVPLSCWQTLQFCPQPIRSPILSKTHSRSTDSKSKTVADPSSQKEGKLKSGQFEGCLSAYTHTDKVIGIRSISRDVEGSCTVLRW